jgi:hypothetical protein
MLSSMPLETQWPSRLADRGSAPMRAKRAIGMAMTANEMARQRRSLLW